MMQVRQVGHTDIFITPIILGAWALGGWMWGGCDETDSIDAIRAALDAGINCIDTAAVYAQGYSEELIGKAIRDIPRDRIVLATKCGRRWDDPQQAGSGAFETFDRNGRPITIRSNSRPESIKFECEQSLRRLGTTYIDLFQIHWPDLTTPLEDSLAAMEALRREGKIRAVGVSNFSVELLRQATAIGALASVQPPYSLLRRDIEKDLLPFCRENHISVLAYSPLERGLLTGNVGPDRQFKPGDHRSKHKLFDVENRRKVLSALEKIRPIADKYHSSLAQVVLNWTIKQPGVTAAIAGARNAQQARYNAGAMHFELADADIRQVGAAFE